MWLNMYQIKLENIWLSQNIIVWRIINTDNTLHFGTKINAGKFVLGHYMYVWTSKFTVFLQLYSHKTFRQILSMEKYLCIFLHQIKAIVYHCSLHRKEDKQTLAELSWVHRHSQAKCHLVQTSCITGIKLFLFAPYNKHLFNQAKLSQSVWQNLDLGHVYTCTDLTAFGLYSRPWPRFSHTDLLLSQWFI